MKTALLIVYIATSPTGYCHPYLRPNFKDYIKHQNHDYTKLYQVHYQIKQRWKLVIVTPKDYATYPDNLKSYPAIKFGRNGSWFPLEKSFKHNPLEAILLHYQLYYYDKDKKEYFKKLTQYHKDKNERILERFKSAEEKGYLSSHSQDPSFKNKYAIYLKKQYPAFNYEDFSKTECWDCEKKKYVKVPTEDYSNEEKYVYSSLYDPVFKTAQKRYMKTFRDGVFNYWDPKKQRYIKISIGIPTRPPFSEPKIIVPNYLENPKHRETEYKAGVYVMKPPKTEIQKIADLYGVTDISAFRFRKEE